jgi:hypothetical protein
MSEWRFVYNTSLPEEVDELATIERVLRAIASSRDRIYRRNEGRNTVVTYVRNVFPQEAVRGTFRPSAIQHEHLAIGAGEANTSPERRTEMLEALRQTLFQGLPPEPYLPNRVDWTYVPKAAEIPPTPAPAKNRFDIIDDD